MYLQFCVLLCFALSNNSVFGAYVPFAKCSAEDSKCQTQAAKTGFSKFAEGIPELGVISLDPLHIDEIEGNDGNLHQKFTNVTVIGYKSCDIEKIKLSLKQSTLDFEVFCPLKMIGDYELHGRLLVLPVEGKGPFSIIGQRFKFVIHSIVNQQDGKDGKKHLHVKNFDIVKIEAPKPVVFDFKNLFNGNKELSDAIHQFANANYKELISELGLIVFQAEFKIIFKTLNNFFKSVPSDELVE